MPVYVAFILGFILAATATIVSYVLIVPAKKRDGLNKFLKWLHDLFNFRFLLIEHILKVFYIFTTALCVSVGVFMLFSVTQMLDFTSLSVSSHYMGGYGLLLIIFGPIVCRLVFEGLMLAVLHLKNTMEINDKLVPQPGSRADIKQSNDRQSS